MELYKKIYTSKDFLQIETILQHGLKNYKREYLLDAKILMDELSLPTDKIKA
jgi:hypothetical protein